MNPCLSLVVVLGLVAGCGSKDPSCSDVSGHVGRMFQPADDYTRDIEAAFLGRCVVDSWTVEVRRCITSTRSLDEPKSCKAKLTAAQAAALDKDLAAAETRQAQGVMPQVCLDYEVQLSAAMSCEAIPQAERDRLKANLATSKRQWAQRPNKQSLAPVCGAAVQALKQATSECTRTRK